MPLCQVAHATVGNSPTGRPGCYPVEMRSRSIARRARLWLLPGILLALPAGADPQRKGFTTRQLTRLSRGEVVTRYWKIPGREVGAGWAAGVIPASPESVFAVVADVVRYKEFFERMAVARVVHQRSPTDFDFYYRIDMPWPMADHSCLTRNLLRVDSKRRRYTRQWKMVKGTFEHNQGAWQVRPWGKGKALLYYSVMLKPRVKAPDSVLHYVSRVALPRSVKAMRQRVASLKQRGRLPAGPLPVPPRR